MTRPLSIPVILGTIRRGRMSAHVARLLVDLLNRRAGVRSELIDIAAIPFAFDDAGEAIKPAAFAAAMNAADGLLPVMRELGLVTIFWDINVGDVGTVFDEGGRLRGFEGLLRMRMENLQLAGYQSHGKIAAPVAV